MPTIPAILLAVSAVLPAAIPAPPPLLLTGGLVRVDARSAPRPAALLLVQGRIAFVGSEKEARRRAAPDTRVVRLGGAVVIPGLADAHGHLQGLGRARESIDLRSLPVAMIAARVKERASSVPEGSWIEGRGWDQNLWPEAAFPGREELDAAAPKHPVLLERVDGHAVWANAAALRAAGIDPEKPAPPDPDGGRILRDAAGRPTGVFIDNAAGVLERAIPAPDAATLARRFLAAAQECVRNGLTSVGDASGYGPGEIAALSTLARAGELPVRVYATVGATPEGLALLDRGAITEGRLPVRAVKLFADGALGSRGAALLAPYADEPATSGLVATSEERIREVVARCFRAGWQPWIHAIGDRGNRMALDAFEGALAVERPKDARPRIEHAQVVSRQDVPRFARLGVIASVQPTHATSDMGWAVKRLGPERIEGAYAYATLLRSGARMAGGSDFPIESCDPRLGLYAATARQETSERLSVAEALALFTEGAAYAQFAEGRRGRIAEGFDADITVLDRDLLDGQRAAIPKLEVLMTVVGGEVVFSRR
jgi:hypothetical protein